MWASYAKFETDMLGVEAGSSGATSVPCMMAGTSLSDICREEYVSKNMIT